MRFTGVLLAEHHDQLIVSFRIIYNKYNCVVCRRIESVIIHIHDERLFLFLGRRCPGTGPQVRIFRHITRLLVAHFNLIAHRAHRFDVFRDFASLERFPTWQLAINDRFK